MESCTTCPACPSSAPMARATSAPLAGCRPSSFTSRRFASPMRAGLPVAPFGTASMKMSTSGCHI
eukprot:4445768-Prymnesium_polylepis.1